MATLTPLVPNGDITTTNLFLWDRTAGAWVESATGGSFAHIDEAVGAIADGDTAVGPTLDHNTTVTTTFDLSATDSDFGDIDTLNIHYDSAVIASPGDDLGFMEIRISNAADSSDFVATTRLHTWNGSAWTDTTPAANLTLALTITAAGLAASKADWDGARFHLTQQSTRTKGNDGAFPILMVDLELTGTYTPAAAASFVADKNKRRINRLLAA